MTWSLIARHANGAFGVAVASRFFAIGALCPHAARGVGALAAQALVNPLYAPAALDALARGIVPAATGGGHAREHGNVTNRCRNTPAPRPRPLATHDRR
jgi:hypothetical protein